jgi:hypothetical protein
MLRRHGSLTRWRHCQYAHLFSTHEPTWMLILFVGGPGFMARALRPYFGQDTESHWLPAG